MATSSSELIVCGEEETLPAENKEVFVAVTTVRDEVLSSTATSSPVPDKEEEEEEATPTPPESSSLSSETGTVTLATTEESLSVLLRHLKTDGGGETGKIDETPDPWNQDFKCSSIFRRWAEKQTANQQSSQVSDVSLQVWT